MPTDEPANGDESSDGRVVDVESEPRNEEDASGREFDEEALRSRFWLLVVLFNFGPIAFFLGVFLVFFEGLTEGYAVAAVGLLVTLAGLRMFRTTRARIGSGGGDVGGNATGGDDDAGGDSGEDGDSVES